MPEEIISQFAKNQIELYFYYNGSKINKGIVEEVKDAVNVLALKHKTNLTVSFNTTKDDDYIAMKSTQNITSNEYYSDAFFAFYQEFLDYTNEVEDKYSNFITLPSR